MGIWPGVGSTPKRNNCMATTLNSLKEVGNASMTTTFSSALYSGDSELDSKSVKITS